MVGFSADSKQVKRAISTGFQKTHKDMWAVRGKQFPIANQDMHIMVTYVKELSFI